ncbi:hypothetical protein LMH87_004466 [Akanthomyces muscarius]|uniref:Methyltransferase n=1 Tax=Akanthomyces muscarius TaxID=2231603 RepID=A0A9W8UHX1_AKAMU|nr:hypothetical protein LMH87_004466 [Akanthomyces muscarius]KAJ4145620.1 hypothetical protein LMH87_004466 [Akanthomyces muscarius]
MWDVVWTDPDKELVGLLTTAPNSPTKASSDTPFSSSYQDTFPSFDECLAQSFGSIDSATAIPVTSFSNGSGCESPSIAALIRILGDLPLRVERQEKLSSISNNPETTSKPKTSDGGTPSIDTLLVTPPRSPSEYPGQSLLSGDLPELPVFLTPPPKSPRRTPPTPLGINNPAAWRTPSQWKAHDAKKAQKAERAVSLKTCAESDIKTESFAVSNTIQSVRSAAGAPTAMVLAKAEQVFAAKADEGQVTGLEDVKRHWMLALLHGRRYIADTGYDKDHPVTSLTATPLVMLLYETKAYASYLSTLHPDTQVYHVTEENPRGSWPHNIHVLRAPPAGAVCFPVAPRIIQTVVYKCLKPGGYFKVTIIDPLPCAGTIGRKLRDWMEKHLFSNIERKSCCLEPSRLFPRLLSDAGLRGKGSWRTKVKFFALQENARGEGYNDPDRSINKLYQERRDKAELRSLAGRMLWVEVWGKHITPPNTWWWDDPECVAECRQLGTFWEYQIIDAFKEECV